MRIPQPKQQVLNGRLCTAKSTATRAVAAGLVACVIVVLGFARLKSGVAWAAQIFNHKSNQVVIQASPENTSTAAVASVKVLVTKVALNTGDAIEPDAVKVISRPSDSLPPDFLSSPDDLKGSVALGPIPANMPVSRTMLGTAVAIIPSSLDRASASTSDDVIFALARHSVAFDLNFSNPTPPRGTRIAIYSVLPNGEHGIITNQAWVSSSQGTKAVVLVSPDTGAVLKAFKSIPLQFEPMANG